MNLRRFLDKQTDLGPDSNILLIGRVCRYLGIEPERIAELGTWRGKGAKRLAELFPGAQIYTIDDYLYREGLKDRMYLKRPTQADWQRRYLETLRELVEFPTVKLLRCSTSEATRVLPNGLDIVFVDAGHNYESVYRDILEWRLKVRDGGLFCGHDFSPKSGHVGVRRAVRELVPDHHVHVGTNMWFDCG